MNSNPKEIVSSNIREMARVLSETTDAQLIEDFLYSLYTVAEAEEIAKRWALVKDIAAGRPQRAIAADMGLSLCKITRGSRELKRPDSPFRKMLSKAGVEVVEKKPKGKQAVK